MVSILAPGRESFVPTPFGEWLQTHHEQLYLPCVAIAEMAQGIGKLRRAGGVEQAERLAHWLDGLLNVYADRILPLDAQAARLAGDISDAATRVRHQIPFSPVFYPSPLMKSST